MISNLVFVTVLSCLMVAAVESELRPHLWRQSYCNVYRHAPKQLNDPVFTLIKEWADPFMQNYSMDHWFCSDGYYRDPGLSFQNTPMLVVIFIALIIIFFKELAELRSEVCNYL